MFLLVCVKRNVDQPPATCTWPEWLNDGVYVYSRKHNVFNQTFTAGIVNIKGSYRATPDKSVYYRDKFCA